MVSDQTVQHGSKVTFACREGFTSSDNLEFACEDGVINSESAQCSCKLISC